MKRLAPQWNIVTIAMYTVELYGLQAVMMYYTFGCCRQGQLARHRRKRLSFEWESTVLRRQTRALARRMQIIIGPSTES